MGDNKMSSPTFLIIDEKPVSLEQALNYLQAAGKFQPFLLEILYHHAINQELQAQADLNSSPEALEQALLDFRVQRELTDPEEFQAWLDSQGVNSETLRQQLARYLAFNQLKTQISQPRLQDYFIERKPFLDQVILSWLVTDTKEAAEALRRRLEAGATFEQLARQASAKENPAIAGEMEGAFRPLVGFWKRLTGSNVSNERDPSPPPLIEIEEQIGWAEMPEELREVIDAEQPGQLVGPLLIDGDWYVVRVEDFLPAELDADLEAQLRDEIFEQWLIEKVATMNVKLQVNES
jgi:parvulin-like peptidyl-prolyl isomerase